MIGRPSLKALRGFAEVIRAGGVAAAARRLAVTPSAVSHLLTELEAELGFELFADRRAGIPSERGRRLADRLGPAFEAVESAVADARRDRAAIRLSTLSTFAALWLIPRLPRISSALPDADILISTATRTVDLAFEPFDCVIRYGRGDWPDLAATLLFRERTGVVGHPRLIAEHPEGAAGAPRLAARSRPEDWSLVRPGDDRPASFLFETRGQMLEAALAGLGVAPIDLELAAGPLAAGHLVVVPGPVVDRAEGYHFACRPARSGERGLRIFRERLLDEVAAARAR